MYIMSSTEKSISAGMSGFPLYAMIDSSKHFRKDHTQRMAIANAAVLTAKSNIQIIKPIKPLLKIMLNILNRLLQCYSERKFKFPLWELNNISTRKL